MLCWFHVLPLISVVLQIFECEVSSSTSSVSALQLIWGTRACEQRSSRTRTVSMFIGCDNLLQLYLVLNSALDARWYSHLRATQVKKKKCAEVFLLLILASLAFVALGIIWYQLTMKLICCGFFFFFSGQPYPSTRLGMGLTSGTFQPLCLQIDLLI